MLMIGIAGKTLAPEEHDWIRAPMVCGVILFNRNFESRSQVTALCAEIRAVRGGEFLIAVDQEGGPVQRFRDGFTALPALALFGERYATDAGSVVVPIRYRGDVYLIAVADTGGAVDEYPNDGNNVRLATVRIEPRAFGDLVTR